MSQDGKRVQRSPCHRMKTANLVLLAMGLFLLAFIVANMIVFCIKGAAPDTLIQCTLGTGGLEALVLAGIKISKVIAGAKSGVGGEDGEEAL